jgi:hypothetical protein
MSPSGNPRRECNRRHFGGFRGFDLRIVTAGEEKPSDTALLVQFDRPHDRPPPIAHAKNDSDVRVQKIIWSENVFTDLRDVHVRSHGSLKHRAGIV